MENTIEGAVTTTELKKKPGRPPTVRSTPVDDKMLELTKDKETKAVLEFLIKRLDSFEESMTSINGRIDGVKERLDDLDAQVRGEESGFDSVLRKEGSDPLVLNKSQQEQYGTLGGQELQDITHKVLGSDCHAFIKSDAILPRSFLSIYVSDRLTGGGSNWRTRQINNASAGQDAKKWCEMVKSNLFKQYSRENKGAPEFRIK